MSGDGKFLWYYGRGQEPDAMYGAEPTRDGILQVAEQETDGEGDFTIVEADKSVTSFDIFDAADVIEQYEDYNEECWGEDGAEIHPTPECKRELEAALNAAFEGWAKKHGMAGTVWAFSTHRNREYFPPRKAEGGAS